MVEYRKMTVQDVEAVFRIEHATFAVPWTLDFFYYEMQENLFAHYVVAEEQDEIIGFCGSWQVIDAVQITNVAVVEQARGRKIGEGLMRKSMEDARFANMKTMSLEVRISNTVAQNLYRKLGFQNGGLRKKYYTDNQEDALVMWVNL